MSVVCPRCGIDKGCANLPSKRLITCEMCKPAYPHGVPANYDKATERAYQLNIKRDER